MPDYNYYDKAEYVTELTRSAERAKAGDDILAMAMVIDTSEPAIARLCQAFTDAASRGAKVTLVIDAQTFMIGETPVPGPLMLTTDLNETNNKLLKQPFKNIHATLENLRQHGGQYFISNKPSRAFSNFYAGRSHIKLALVNDRIFIGSSNLEHMDYIDLMTEWNDAKTAAWLRQLLAKITGVRTARQGLNDTDQTYEIDHSSNIFVDAGVPRQSAIFKHAIQLIDDAKEHLLITCQYFPGGPTGQRLLAAHQRGVDVQIYYSPPSRHGIQLPGQWLYNQYERRRLPAKFFEHELTKMPKMHAKILASESTAMIGSHNYIEQGVNFGTAEIALLRRDPQFSQDLINKIEKQLNV